MPNEAFSKSLQFVLRWEGGFVDHPSDPGGRTNRGVTQKVYDGWRVRQGAPVQDVVRITDDEVAAIYDGEYWIPASCDALRRDLDLVEFDTAVNMGVGRALRFLQASVGCVIDGSFGPATAQAVADCDPATATSAYCAAREAYYRKLVTVNPRLSVFLKGWMNRLNALRAEVGLPGFEAAVPLDFGDAGYIAKVPDVGIDANYDL